jgi:cysteine-rich repeat protein
MRGLRWWLCLVAGVAPAFGAAVALAEPVSLTDPTWGNGTHDGVVAPGEHAVSSVGINSGFGDVLGIGSRLYLDASTNGTLAVALESGGGDLNDVAVIYLDCASGGFGDTFGFADDADAHRRAISGRGLGGQSSELTFAPGFEPELAIAFNAAFAGLWRLADGGAGSHVFVADLGLLPTPANPAAGAWEMLAHISDFGSVEGGGCDYVATYINASNAFRSNEFHGVAAATVGSTNPGSDVSVVLGAGDFNAFFAPGEPLHAGTLAFTGFSADGDGDLAFVVLQDLDDATIYFTDKQVLPGGGLGAGEGVLAWQSGAVSAGTVVVFSSIAGTPAASTGTLTKDSGTLDLDHLSEGVLAFQGDSGTAPVAFLAGCANAAGAAGVPADADLDEGGNFVTFAAGGAAGGVYSGPRADQTSLGLYLQQINDPANWTVESIDGQALLPFDQTPFGLADICGDGVQGSSEVCEASTEAAVDTTVGAVAAQQSSAAGVDGLAQSFTLQSQVVLRSIELEFGDAAACAGAVVQVAEVPPNGTPAFGASALVTGTLDSAATVQGGSWRAAPVAVTLNPGSYAVIVTGLGAGCALVRDTGDPYPGGASFALAAGATTWTIEDAGGADYHLVLTTPVATATCDADCTLAECGDGTLNPAHGELCELTAPGDEALCDPDCTPATCGDGTLNTAAGETCDHAGASLACTADCSQSLCGDGVLNALSEDCDGGSGAVVDTLGGLAPDGVASPPRLLGQTLTLTQPTAVGAVELLVQAAAAGACDGAVVELAPATGGVPDGAALPLATAVLSGQPLIGGAVTVRAELSASLDAGNYVVIVDVRPAAGDCLMRQSSLNPYAAGQAWAATSTGSDVLDGPLGDGVDLALRLTTRGGAAANPVCDDDCTDAKCGDGRVNAFADEQCDDGGASATCTSACHVSSCGDAVVNAAASEICDNGTGAAGLGCAADCESVEIGWVCPAGGGACACAPGFSGADCATFAQVVTTESDLVADDGLCSLREAVAALNTGTPSGATSGECAAGTAGGSISLPAGTYALGIAGADEDANQTGDLDLFVAMAIVGAGVDATVVSGAGLDRVLHLQGGPLWLEGLTLTGGVAAEGGCVLEAPLVGLSVTDVRLQGCTAGEGGGGAIATSGGSLALERVTFIDNSAPYGAAISHGAEVGGALTALDCAFTDNTGTGATSTTGAVVSLAATTDGVAQFERCLFTGNTGDRLLYTRGHATRLRNCTIAGNATDSPDAPLIGLGDGGPGVLTIEHSTIANNDAGVVFGQSDAPSEPLKLTGSVIASAGGGGCTELGSISSYGGNVLHPSCDDGHAGDVVTAEPLLGALGDNGGATLTMAPLAGSPALGLAACKDVDGGLIAADQRGELRPGAACTAGAYEVVCGDADLAGDEGCDDGEHDAGDGCDPACVVEFDSICSGEPSVCVGNTCGDGEVAGNEACDTAGESATCDADCTAVECGDGAVNTAAAEVCDDGDAVDDDGCSNLCAPSLGFVCDQSEPSVCASTCGDGTKASDELCDTGGDSADCDADCTPPECGDGLWNASADEACDDGGESAACDADCSVPECGDGVHNALAGEVCDAGGQTADCEADCSEPVCGDGVYNPLAAESCDDGDADDANGCDGVCKPSFGFVCDAAGACASECGDGVRAQDEACDDGDGDDGDGCSSICEVEAGYSCSGDGPSVCAAGCGDGIVAGAEACDDDGNAPDDGCTPDCAVEPGYKCDGQSPSVCVVACGDGVVDAGEDCEVAVDGAGACDPDCTEAICGDGTLNLAAGEACDDGAETASCNADCSVATCGDSLVNTTAGEECDDGGEVDDDGCDAGCVVEPGYVCVGVGAGSCASTCGDGIVASDEGCDDGGLDDDDGCDGACVVEAGYSCVGTAPSMCTVGCGDGVVAGLEGCDDGDLDGGDGCSSDCEIESGFACQGTAPSVCASACGDEVVASDEGCDDGDADGGDGCSAGCDVELGFACSGAPSVCASTCGDGVAASDEGCDDGDPDGGDGCDADCAVEAGFACAGQPSACASECGDAELASDEACDDGGTVDDDGCSAGCQWEATALYVTELHLGELPGGAAPRQWLELRNGTSVALDLRAIGVVLANAGGATLDLGGELCAEAKAGAAVVDPGAYAVIALHAAALADGLPANIVCGGSFGLDPGGDGLTVSVGAAALDTVDYSGFACLLAGQTAVAGSRSFELSDSESRSADENDDGAAWCLASPAADLGTEGGAFGSPGAAGTCAEFACDGADDDCDGTTDEAFADADLDGLCDGLDCEPDLATCTDDCAVDLDTDGVADCADGCIDADQDGWGTPGGAAASTCAEVGGQAVSDCDDAEAAVSPEATELCTGGVDDDCDGLTDCEQSGCSTDTACGAADFDDDGVPNALEVLCGGDPTDGANTPSAEDLADPDEDGEPNCVDTDDDGDTLTDAQEDALGTDPLKVDSDGDGAADDEEVGCGSDPVDATSLPADLDKSGVCDGAEGDGDGDGVIDALENLCGTDPLDAADAPAPGSLADSDGDGVLDCATADGGGKSGGGCGGAGGGGSQGLPLLLLAVALLGWVRRRVQPAE